MENAICFMNSICDNTNELGYRYKISLTESDEKQYL